MTDFDELFKKIEGHQIPGGCDACDAYQTVESPSEGVAVLTVHHDDDCPFLRARKARLN